MNLKPKVSLLFLCVLLISVVSAAIVVYYSKPFNHTIIRTGLDVLACKPSVADYRDKIVTTSLDETGSVILSITTDYGVSAMFITFQVDATYQGSEVTGLISNVQAWYVTIWHYLQLPSSLDHIDKVEEVPVTIEGSSAIDINRMRYGYYEGNVPPTTTNGLLLTFSFDSSNTNVPVDKPIDLVITVTISSG